MIGFFDRKRCTNPWRQILTAARKDGVDFTLSSGFRSNLEQAVLRRLYLAGKGPLAAKPGESTHNLAGWRQGADIGPSAEAVQDLVDWVRSKGMLVARTVPGEYWHVNLLAEPTRGELRAMKGPTLRERLKQAYADRKRQTRRSRVEFFNRRIKAIKRRLK